MRLNQNETFFVYFVECWCSNIMKEGTKCYLFVFVCATCKFTLSIFHFTTTKSSSKCSRKHMSHSVWLQNLENNKRNTENAAAAGQMSSCCLPLSLVYLYVMKTPFHIISCWVIEKLDHAFNSPFWILGSISKRQGH